MKDTVHEHDSREEFSHPIYIAIFIYILHRKQVIQRDAGGRRVGGREGEVDDEKVGGSPSVSR